MTSSDRDIDLDRAGAADEARVAEGDEGKAREEDAGRGPVEEEREDLDLQREQS